MPVYGLTRASLAKQADSPAVQEDRIRAACTALGLAEPIILDEPLGTSGRTTKFSERPQGKWALENLRKGDTLIVTKLDRLGRQVPDIRQTIDALKACGVRVIVLNVGGGVLDMKSSGSKLTVNALAMVAEHEGDIISERTSEAMQWMKKNGHRISQSPGLGRKLVAVPRALTKKAAQKYTTAWDEAQLRIIREIVERHDGGESFASIAGSLMAHGVRDEVGVVWGAPDPKQKPKHNGALRTKKVRRAYRWYKSMKAAGALP